MAFPDYYSDKGYKVNTENSKVTSAMPWIFYERSGLEVIEEPRRVKFRASFSYQNLNIGIVSKLRFVLAKYDLEGNFYGFEELDDQLSICKQPTTD